MNTQFELKKELSQNRTFSYLARRKGRNLKFHLKSNQRSLDTIVAAHEAKVETHHFVSIEVLVSIGLPFVVGFFFAA